jgi:hypothetical protein
MTSPERQRFDVDALNEDDPFEIDDGNRPHLFKHGLCPADLYDLWDCDPAYFPAQPDGEADWLLVGSAPGNAYLCAPLAPPNGERVDQCRPIGLYQASFTLTTQYVVMIERG